MAFPTDVDVTWLNPATVQLDAGELRRADAALFAGAAGGLVAGGVVRHSDSSLAVTVTSADEVTVAPGSVVVPGNSTAVGAYRGSLAAPATGNLAARNATYGRIDLVVFRVLDTDVVGSHSAYVGRVEILTGAPSATPAAPALPDLAVELGRITVPATGGGAASVDSTYRTYASAIGAPLVVPTAARLPESAALWQEAVALDTGIAYVWTGTVWGLKVPVFTGSVPAQTMTSGSLVTVNVTFPVGAFTAAPRAATAQLTSFVSGATNVVARHCDQVTKDGCRAVFVNAGPDTTFTSPLPFQVVVTR